jgi:hypothetical protein
MSSPCLSLCVYDFLHQYLLLNAWVNLYEIYVHMIIMAPDLILSAYLKYLLHWYLFLCPNPYYRWYVKDR